MDREKIAFAGIFDVLGDSGIITGPRAILVIILLPLLKKLTKEVISKAT
jgi:hypothetical protein